MEPYSTFNNYVDGDDENNENDENDLLLIKSESELLIPNDISIKNERGHSLGQKSISTIGSFIFIVNQIYGPGVLSIPVVFQQSGFIMTMISLTFFLFVSCLASTMLCESLALIPGNRNFDKHIEYSVAIKYYFGSKAHFFFQIINNLCIQCYNIASIVICAQSLDEFFLLIFKKTFALTLYPHFDFISTDDVSQLYTSGSLNITIGYLIICIISIPTSLMNLDDNVKIVQTISFIFLFILLGEFIVQFILNGLELDRVPAFGDNYGQLVSVFIFSWAYPMFIPSWVNEKKDSVSVNKVVWASGIFSWFGYLFIGLLCALSYGYLGTDNILTLLGLPPSPLVTRISSYLFSLGVIMPGIPVCFITTRYNLYVGHICGKKSSYFWGVIAPWLISFIFCQQRIFAQLLNWSSLILNSAVNFIIPFVVYLKATSASGNSVHYRCSVNNNNNGAVGVDDDDVNVYRKKHISPVQPYPKRIEKYDRIITLAVLVVTVVICLTQIVYDIVLAVQGHDILDH